MLTHTINNSVSSISLVSWHSRNKDVVVASKVTRDVNQSLVVISLGQIKNVLAVAVVHNPCLEGVVAELGERPVHENMTHVVKDNTTVKGVNLHGRTSEVVDIETKVRKRGFVDGDQRSGVPSG